MDRMVLVLLLLSRSLAMELGWKECSFKRDRVFWSLKLTVEMDGLSSPVSKLSAHVSGTEYPYPRDLL